jgi:hypothetical protein
MPKERSKVQANYKSAHYGRRLRIKQSSDVI